MKSEQGKYISKLNLRHFRPSVRRIGKIEIYFRNKGTVAVNSPNGSVVFINVGTANFYRDSWKPFTEKLKRRNNLVSLFDIIDISAKYGVPSVSPRHRPKVPTDIYRHPSRYIEKRNRDEKKK